jgi:hypothetical protein
MRFRLGSAGWYTEQILQGGWPDGFRFNFGIGYQFGRKKLPIPVVEKEPEPEPVEEDHTVEFEPPPPPDEDMYSGGGSTVAGVILFPANDSTLYSKKEKPNGLDDFTMTWNDRTFNLVSKFIQSNTGYKVVVEGFANPTTGTEEENIQFLIPLSMARAEYVMNELIKMGVPPENIEIKASGNKDAMTRTALENRRVEMRFERK